MAGPCFIGVDVGTGSVRAGVFDEDGGLLGHASRTLKLWKNGDHVEQSSADIWEKTCEAVREARTAADIAKERVVGIGFDATCSMVVVAKDGEPLPVGLSGEPARNVIVWMDHRALKETDDINATSHPVLSFVGGQISPEMETPKLLWLSRHAPETFAKAGHFFDLPDYLSFRATGDSARSNCTVVCKWTYLGHEKRWDRSYFEEIGLGQLAGEEFDRIGPRVIDVATPIASGLTEKAARELDLLAGIAVGASLIDAHSGGLGTLGAGGRDPSTEMAVIAGTSACTMTLSRQPRFVEGVWGPYFGALLPGFWLNEGGQSAFGAALDNAVSLHPAFAAARDAAEAAGQPLLAFLEERAVQRAGTLEAASLIGAGLDVVPEFLGNRSPDPDPHASAIISGLRLGADLDDLVDLYVATLRGLAYGTVDIVERLRANGQTIDRLILSGGFAKSALMRRILSDATGSDVELAGSKEPVLLGAAMLGAVAARVYQDVAAAASRMVHRGDNLQSDPEKAAFHDKAHARYRLLKQVQRELRALV